MKSTVHVMVLVLVAGVSLRAQSERPSVIKKAEAALRVSATHRVEPTSPADVRVTGSVTVEIVVDEQGNVTSALFP